MFLRKVITLSCQLIWNTPDQSCPKNFSNPSIELQLFPFLIEAENIHPKCYNLLQI